MYVIPAINIGTVFFLNFNPSWGALTLWGIYNTQLNYSNLKVRMKKRLLNKIKSTWSISFNKSRPNMFFIIKEF